ncbi:MAG TPA: hypothetical protein DCX06_06710 [Opitutae bacterium]|nr:hypothetical protein [Opitutae bacterium]
MIAVAWQWIFAASMHTKPAIAAQATLVFSVWLTYMADRLFDVAKRDPSQLLSQRHRYAKKYATPLWRIWWIILITNIVIAVTSLTFDTLMRGMILLACCLLYTLLNQLLSRRFFPKELLVALIFTGGVIVLLEPPFLLPAATSFMCICLFNCLALGHKERSVDAALKVRSLASVRSLRLAWLVSIVAIACLPYIDGTLVVCLALTMLLSALIVHYRERYSCEAFRSVLDAAMLSGLIPLFFN